jgi:hypothetical protein
MLDFCEAGRRPAGVHARPTGPVEELRRRAARQVRCCRARRSAVAAVAQVTPSRSTSARVSGVADLPVPLRLPPPPAGWVRYSIGLLDLAFPAGAGGYCGGTDMVVVSVVQDCIPGGGPTANQPVVVLPAAKRTTGVQTEMASLECGSPRPARSRPTTSPLSTSGSRCAAPWAGASRRP